MILKDKVYGKKEVNEKVLIDLINLKEVQRLKKISQFGFPDEYYHLPVYSRFEHSVGVFLLLKTLSANIKEQIAGLLHDISHAAFSHVIDWVVGDPTKEDYQDKVFSEILEKSSIPLILSKHGFDYKDFLDLEKFKILEQDAPLLCADRFDYAIREIVDFESKENVDLILSSLKVIDNRMIFSNVWAGEIFAKGYMRCQTQHWVGNQARARFYILAKILKIGLNKKIIKFGDLKTTDKRVIDILERSGNKEILENLDLLRDGFEVEDSENDKGIVLKKKFRYIDPEIFVDGYVKRLSEISDEYSNILDKEKRRSFDNKKINIVKLDEHRKVL